MVETYDHQCQLTGKKKRENLAIILSSPCETPSNGTHLKTCRVIRKPIAHMMVQIYDHPCQLTRENKPEDLAIILSSLCETSSNGITIHLKTCRVIRELTGYMMVEIYISIQVRELIGHTIVAIYDH